MDSYGIIRSAVLSKQCLTATYESRVRHFSPHCLGRNKNGGQSVMAFQYAGQSSKPLPPAGQWRCFELHKLSLIHTNDDAWHTGFDHGRPNTCVKHVDVDAH